jgi:hypothetical protein
MLAKQIANDMGEAKLLYYAKLKELMKQNKKNKTS